MIQVKAVAVQNITLQKRFIKIPSGLRLLNTCTGWIDFFFIVFLCGDSSSPEQVVDALLFKVTAVKT